MFEDHRGLNGTGARGSRGRGRSAELGPPTRRDVLERELARMLFGDVDVALVDDGAVQSTGGPRQT